MQAIPLGPEVGDRTTLSDGGDHIGRAPKTGEDESSPEQALGGPGREDAHIECQDGQLDKRSLKEV